MMTVLISGGTGFVGLALAERIVAASLDDERAIRAAAFRPPYDLGTALGNYLRWLGKPSMMGADSAT
ncbi:MAG: hypothetical protein ACREDI_10610 [Roseiarcus sp.]